MALVSTPRTSSSSWHRTVSCCSANPGRLTVSSAMPGATTRRSSLESLVHARRSRRVRRHFARRPSTRGARRRSSTASHTPMAPGATVQSIANNMIDDPAVNGFIVTLRGLTTRREGDRASGLGRRAARRRSQTSAPVATRRARLPGPRRGRRSLCSPRSCKWTSCTCFEAMPDAAFRDARLPAMVTSPSGPELLSTGPDVLTCQLRARHKPANGGL